MYRDSSTVLDEHDRAVGAILIGEALIDDCERAQARLQGLDKAARWRAVTGVHDAYPEIWRYLDRARRVLSSRGANTTGYDELRPHARRAPSCGDEASIDRVALDDAKRAIAELKLAVPGADWKAIETRTQGLIHAPQLRRTKHRLALAGIVAAFAFAVIAWLLALVPEHRAGRSDEMRRSLASIAQQRKAEIESLQAQLGERCDRDLARELTKQLVFDGRVEDARAFGDGYLSRCGADEKVAHWAHAPRPGH